MGLHEDVEFRTVDGTTLRGRLFSASSRGPGVVMAPGFNATKEMVGLPNTAAAFQAAGITALIYDNRGIGLSEGYPRNDINLFRDVDDISDALTFLNSTPSVDPRRGVGLWGMSFGATVAMVATAVDPRVCFVVAVCPATEITYDWPKLRSLLSSAAKDRESRLKGNDPFYVPMVTKKGENPAGIGLGLEQDAIMRLLQAENDANPLRSSLAPNHVNRTTVATYRSLLLWDMRHMWRYIHQPVLFVVPEQDHLVGMDKQLHHYESLPGPKRIHIQKNATHMGILECADQADINRLQVEFIGDSLDGKVA